MGGPGVGGCNVSHAQAHPGQALGCPPSLPRIFIFMFFFSSSLFLSSPPARPTFVGLSLSLLVFAFLPLFPSSCLSLFSLPLSRDSLCPVSLTVCVSLSPPSLSYLPGSRMTVLVYSSRRTVSLCGSVMLDA